MVIELKNNELNGIGFTHRLFSVNERTETVRDQEVSFLFFKDNELNFEIGLHFLPKL